MDNTNKKFPVCVLVDSRDAVINSVKVTCLSRSPTVALILTMCSAQVSMHHAAWRIKIELMQFGEKTSSQISHLQQLSADPTMKHHQNTSERTTYRHWIICSCNVLCGGEKGLKRTTGMFFSLPCSKKKAWNVTVVTQQSMCAVISPYPSVT